MDVAVALVAGFAIGLMVGYALAVEAAMRDIKRWVRENHLERTRGD